MATYYLDSSALVKRYAQEVGSDWIIGLTGLQAKNEIFTALVTGVEIVAAMARRERLGSISGHDVKEAVAIFKSHFKPEYRIVMITTGVIDRAMDLAEEHGLRGYDAIQLASALTIQAELPASGVSPFAFVSADINLNEAAQAAGLAVENPNTHP